MHVILATIRRRQASVALRNIAAAAAAADSLGGQRRLWRGRGHHHVIQGEGEGAGERCPGDSEGEAEVMMVGARRVQIAGIQRHTGQSLFARPHLLFHGDKEQLHPP